MPTDPDWAGGTLYVDERSRLVDAPPDVLWAVIEGIGGDVRVVLVGAGVDRAGLIDRLWGGPGLRRGRRNPYDLQLGDAVDCWRVEEIVDGELLRLRAEMKVPGRAWLDLGIVRDDAGGTLFHQRAVFAPRGLWGRVYWWPCARSTGSCSAACSATSPSRPRPAPQPARPPAGCPRADPAPRTS